MIKLVRQNDEELLKFALDMTTLSEAEGVVLDSLAGDIKNLNKNLLEVIKTAQTEADILEQEGRLPPIDNPEEKKDDAETPEEDKKKASGDGEDEEQLVLKTRTPMEIFTKKAKDKVDDALSLLSKLKETYAGVLKYFGEDDNMQTNDFFGTLQKFVLEFKVAADHVDKLERARVSVRNEE